MTAHAFWDRTEHTDTLPDEQPPDPEPTTRDEPGVRHVVLTPASTITVRRVRWTWDQRIAEGTLALLAGREGLGKSTLAYHLAAQVTRGQLVGEYHGQPRDVLVAATEDSWEHTIVPRLIAARADLDRIYRIDVETHDHLRLSLSLPRDYADIREAAETKDVGLLLLDPLMSVIDARLDTHRDREVRQALEPLAALADHSHMAVLGLIHHNKSGSNDALQLVMGSKAFAAVARSVHTCITDPDDETMTRKIFATSKNNLGRIDLPMLAFTIVGHAVETADDGTAWTSAIRWLGEVKGTMHELMNRASDPDKGATSEAEQWLDDYLTHAGGEAAKADIVKASRANGISERTLQRARERLGLQSASAGGFPRTTYWSLPGAVPDTPHNGQSCQDVPSMAQLSDPQLCQLPGESPSWHDRTYRDNTEGESPVVPSCASVPTPRARGTTANHTDPLDFGDVVAPICTECGWPLDHDRHEAECGGGL